jgi:hypothetical protein
MNFIIPFLNLLLSFKFLLYFTKEFLHFLFFPSKIRNNFFILLNFLDKIKIIYKKILKFLENIQVINDKIISINFFHFFSGYIFHVNQ